MSGHHSRLGTHFFYPKCDNGWNNYNLGPNPFTNNTWQHLAVTLKYSTKEVKIFVNGDSDSLYYGECSCLVDQSRKY